MAKLARLKVQQEQLILKRRDDLGREEQKLVVIEEEAAKLDKVLFAIETELNQRKAEEETRRQQEAEAAKALADDLMARKPEAIENEECPEPILLGEKALNSNSIFLMRSRREGVKAEMDKLMKRSDEALSGGDKLESDRLFRIVMTWDKLRAALEKRAAQLEESAAQKIADAQARKERREERERAQAQQDRQAELHREEFRRRQAERETEDNKPNSETLSEDLRFLQ